MQGGVERDVIELRTAVFGNGHRGMKWELQDARSRLERAERDITETKARAESAEKGTERMSLLIAELDKAQDELETKVELMSEKSIERRDGAALSRKERYTMYGVIIAAALTQIGGIIIVLLKG